jgi:signal peptidase I
VGKRERLRPGKSLKRPKQGILSVIGKNLYRLDPFTYADILLERIGQKENNLVVWPVYLLTAFLSAWLIYTILGLILGTRAPAVIVISGSMEPTFYRGDIMVLTGVSPENLNAQEVVLPFSVRDKNLSQYAKTYCAIEDVNELIECRQIIPYAKKGVIPPSKFVTKRICFPSVDKCIELNKEGDIVVYMSDTYKRPIIHRVVVKIRANDGTFVLTKGDSIYNPLIDQEAGLAGSAVPIEKLEGKVFFMIPKLGYIKLIIVDDIPCILSHLSNFTEVCELP